VAPGGGVETVVEVPGRPSGLGWLPDGRLLVVSMHEHRVMRLDPSGLVLHADLSAWCGGDANDMVVDAAGRAYVGNIGFDLERQPIEPRATHVVRVDPDGRAGPVASDLMAPNGMVITPDGGTLIVGESGAGCLTAFDVAGDGGLSNRRIFAPVEPGGAPDGICLDAEGQVWAASPFTGSVVRVAEGGEITATVFVEDAGAFACMLGGPDRKTLVICCAADHSRSNTVALRSGRIDVAPVDVPGAGLP